MIALMLAAAATAPSPYPMEERAWRYHCPDGAIVEARYRDGGALLIYKERAIVMRPAPAASGVRYVGGGWQWWTKGMREGMIAPVKPNATEAAAPGPTCVSRQKLR